MQNIFINKEKVKKNFYNCRLDYEDHALIQKEMAAHLFSKLDKGYHSILELGCGLGTYTQYLYKECAFVDYFALDFIPEYQTIFQYKFPQINFISFDMDKLDQLFPSYYFNLITSNASIQWSNDPKKLIHTCMKKLNHNGTLALSFFGDKNYCEIKDIFNIGLDYFSELDLNEIMNEYTVTYFYQEEKKLHFQNTIDIFRHIKKTGVGGLMQTYLSKTQCREYEKKYQNILTYHPIYLILKNQ